MWQPFYKDNPAIDRNKFIIAGEKDNGGRRFKCFEDWRDFERYLIQVPENKRQFYEVIFGEKAQRIYFDIDAPEGLPIDFLDHLFGAIRIYLRNTFGFNVQDQELTLCETLGSTKVSYHLILDYYVSSNQHNRAFCEQIKNLLLPTDQPYIDIAVYSTFQNFRILGCQKRDSGRIKRLIQYQQIPDGKTRYESELERTLITVTRNSEYVAIYANSKPVIVPINIKDDQVEQALELLGAPGSFKYLRTNGSLIILKRLKSTYCTVCQKNHDKENPYLAIRSGKVFFCCRRVKQEVLLGTINKSDSESEEVEPEPVREITAPRRPYSSEVSIRRKVHNR